MEITIRDYGDDDRDSCLALYSELSQHYADIYGDLAIANGESSRWLDTLRKSYEYSGTWIAEVDGQIVGLAGLLANGEEGRIEPVIVSSSCRNNGIGARLVRHLVEVAKKKNIRFLSIQPTARNEEALSLYVRLGFNMLGHVELFQDLSTESTREWKSGIEIHGHKLRY